MGVCRSRKGYVHGDYLELIEKAEQNSELDLAMLIHLMGMMFDGTEGFDSIFAGIFEGFFGAETDTTEDGKSPLAFTPDGNLTLIDDFLQIEVPGDEETEQVEKQFITVQSKNGNTFYIVIDRNGETENVYFLNLVDEADLMALMESEEGETAVPTCSCTDKCVVGAINTNCEICRTNMSECTGKEPVVEPEPEQPTEPVEEPDEKKSANFLPLIIVLIAGAGGFAVYWFKFRKPKTKTTGNSDLDDYDFGQDDEDYDEETELDDIIFCSFNDLKSYILAINNRKTLLIDLISFFAFLFTAIPPNIVSHFGSFFHNRQSVLIDDVNICVNLFFAFAPKESVN